MNWPFENDTSVVEKRLASRSIKAEKRRSVFVILTIALAVCLMGTLCFLYSAQQLKTLDGILGQYQAGCGGLTRRRSPGWWTPENLRNGAAPRRRGPPAMRTAFCRSALSARR